MPQTVYKITGSSATKPAELPEGFTVEETTARFSFRLRTGGRVIAVEDSVMPCSAAFLDCGSLAVHLSPDDTRKLRDALSATLGEAAPKLRAFKDCDNDKWFEVETDRFLLGRSRASAEEAFRDYPTGGQAFVFINDAYKPLTPITE